MRQSMEYANTVWHNCAQEQSERLERIQLECAQIVTGSVKGTKHKQLYSETGWLSLAERRTHSQITKKDELVNHLATREFILKYPAPTNSNIT